jgi:KaiC/GvpD/RAD55 family RecA-like ATPase
MLYKSLIGKALRKNSRVSKFYIVDLPIHLMTIRKQLHDVLDLTAELTRKNVNKDVRHTLVIDRMGLPEHETHRYIHELESLGMIKIQPRMNHATDEKGREFRLINITNEGLQELSSNQTSPLD